VIKEKKVAFQKKGRLELDDMVVSGRIAGGRKGESRGPPRG